MARASASGGGFGGGYGGIVPASGGTEASYMNNMMEWQSPGLESMLSNFQNQYQSALNYNRNQYEQVRAGYLADHQRQRDRLDQWERDRLGESNARYQGLVDDANRASYSTGIGNRTVLNSLLQGYGAQNDYNKNQIMNDVGEQRLGLESSLTRDLLGHQERYRVPLPDYGTMANLAQQIAQNSLQYQQSIYNRYQEPLYQSAISGGGRTTMLGSGGSTPNSFFDYVAAGGLYTKPQAAGLYGQMQRTGGRVFG